MNAATGDYAGAMPIRSDVADEAVSPLVRKAAAWSWRMLVILAAVVAVVWVLAKVSLIVVPVLIATILTALLLPAVDWLDKHDFHRGGAVAAVLLGGLAILGGIMAFVVTQFIEGLPDLVEQVTRSIDSFTDWLIQGPIHLSREQIDHAGDAAIEALQNNQSRVTSGALSTAATLTEIVTGALLVLFTLIFFLHGGRNIFAFVTKAFPIDYRERVREAGAAGFGSLIGYVRATFLVALVDAVGIGAGLAIMGVPLALPLASLVFLGAFIPLIGAVVTGFLAVVVALLAKGFIYALITLGLILAVQQLEAHVLQPLVMGRAVSIHPLGVVLGIAAGGVLAGIIGALLAVPIIAFLNSAIRVLLARDPEAETERQAAAMETDPGPVITAEPDEVTAGGEGTAAGTTADDLRDAAGPPR